MKKRLTGGGYLVLAGIFILWGAYYLGVLLGARDQVGFIITGWSLILAAQGLVTLTWMLYYWEDPEHARKFGAPSHLWPARIGISALIPARDEAKVIKDTIRAVDLIEYPEHLKETLILCRSDDQTTIDAVQSEICQIGKSNIRLVIFEGGPLNKPHALNIGLRNARMDYVCIFDAEDHPHPSLYNLVNTVVVNKKCEVVQSGVQLMNFGSNWFSMFNVLEYFFWFKSGLAFFWNLGKITPLGGNTVFFKKSMLEAVGGWDTASLTEDADIAVRATVAGARIHTFYEPLVATREETPPTVEQLLRQRTRWNQGFLQILAKGDWSQLPGVRAKAVAMYILASPLVPVLTLGYLPVGLAAAIWVKESITVSMFAYLPAYIFVAQIITLLFGVYEFSRNFGVRVGIGSYVKLMLYYLPYQVIMAAASARAVSKMLAGKWAWEKTVHTNAHRAQVAWEVA